MSIPNKNLYLCFSSKLKVFILFTFLSVYAQTPNVEFEKIGMERGLSFNMITDILQDKRGFIWVATWSGLNRYDGYKFKIYKHIDGDSKSLRVNKIACLLEDKAGRLWVGTFGGGLSLFNREEENFTNFIHTPEDSTSIITDKILSIFEDSKSRLWIGTRDIGVSLLENSSEKITSKDSNNIKFINITGNNQNPYSLKGNGILSFAEDKSGNIWMGSNNGWLNKLLPDTTGIEGFKFLSYYPGPEILRSYSNLSSENLLVDKHQSETIWITDYHNGLYWFDSETEKFIYKFPFKNFKKKLPLVDISTIEIDNNEYWIGGYGIDIYNFKLDKFGKIDSPFNRYKLSKIKYYSKQKLSIEHLFKDRSGIIWIGSESQGLFTLKNKNRFLTYNFPLKEGFSPGVHVLSVLEDNSNNVWIGTSQGLFVYNYKNKNYKKFQYNPKIKGSLSSNIVYSIHQDVTNNIWVGTSKGLDKFNNDKNNFTNYKHNPKDSTSISSGEIIKIFSDSKGTLWIGSWNGGLNKLIKTGEKEEVQFLHYQFDKTEHASISNNRIMSIAEDKKGQLWFGTADGGLNKLVSDYSISPDGLITKPIFKSFINNPNELNSLSSNDVRVIHIGKNGILWLGTFGGGLNKFIPPENEEQPTKFYHYNQNDGLANDIVRNILEDDSGNLWISTAQGLSKFDIENEKFWNFNVSDGLQTDNFEDVAFKSKKNGRLFFGGVGGLVSFNPADFRINKYIPKVIITSFKHYNINDGKMIEEKGISEKKEISLSHKENILSFEFSLLNFNNSLKNNYAYKLEGYNNNWIHLGTKRDVTFTNLSPGKYTLFVKGSNSDGVWNKEEASIILLITPPWWQTWWAYILFGFSILFTLYFIRRYELGRIKLRNQLKIEKVEIGTLRKLDTLKTKFFTNISHEFRTPLTLILGQIDSVQSTNLDVKLKEKLHVAYKNAQRILRLVNQLLDLSKIDAGKFKLNTKTYNIVSFLKNIFFSFESSAEKKNIELKLLTSKDEICVEMEYEKMEKVFYNIISNAFKFTSNGGKITIEISTIPKIKDNKYIQESSSKTVIISIRDNGIGIPQNRQPMIFNRFYQVNSSETDHFSGTGIGLAIAKELVELHKGTISVISEEGKGTEFIITLPVSKNTNAKTDIDTTESSNKFIDEKNKELSDLNQNEKNPDTDITITNNKQIILIVEDNADIRNYIKEQLTANYCLIEAENGLEGFELAENRIPDLIITDVMMPKLDGYEFSKKLRQSEKTSHIPIIMLTAKASLDEKIEGLETGIDAFLTKPFNAKELGVRISKLLYQREQLRKKYGHITQLKPSEINVQSIDQVFIKKVLDVIEQNIETEIFGVETLASKVNMSVSQLNRKLGAIISQSSGKLIRSMRLQRAADLLKHNSGTIAEICYQVGFSDQANFTRAFKKQFGKSPSAYKRSINQTLK